MENFELRIKSIPEVSYYIFHIQLVYLKSLIQPGFGNNLLAIAHDALGIHGVYAGCDLLMANNSLLH